MLLLVGSGNKKREAQFNLTNSDTSFYQHHFHLA